MASLLLCPLLTVCGPGQGDTEAGGSAGDGTVTEPAEWLRGIAPAAANGVPSVVTLTSASGLAGQALPEPVIDQFGLAFSPRLLLARPGDVRFVNSESALSHNVRVQRIDTGASVFDDDAVAGDELLVRLTDEGAYDVVCDMHPGMRAFVFVTGAPHAAIAADDGSFDLGAVAPGTYVARVWTAADGFREPISIDVVGPRTEVDLRPND